MSGEIEIKVRGYHLDMFSHVNNARYLEFLEEARWNHFEGSGLTVEDLFKRGISLAVVNININYKYPATFGDILLINTSFKEIRNRSMVVSQEIYLKDKNTKVVEAEVIFAFIDLKTGKPVIVDDELKKYLQNL